MKKKMAAGIVAAGLIVAGGTGFYFGNANDHATIPVGMDSSQVTPMMNTTSTGGLQQLVQKSTQSPNQDENSTFEQMLPFMKKMHPNLSDQELKTLFDSMYGKNGSPGCQAIMGNFQGNQQ